MGGDLFFRDSKDHESLGCSLFRRVTMKEPRAHRPTPRTLSATPPPSSRVPQSAAYQTRFPSLVAIIAGGALVPACHEVECGSSRADELQTHGSESLRAARDGRASEALREIGVATGVVGHTATRAAPQGGVRAVPPTPPVEQPTPVQPQQVEPPITTLGEPMPVSPAPIVTPPPQPPRTPTRVTPTHRSPSRGGARRVAPQPAARTGGDFNAVGPLPLDPTTRRV